MDNMTDTATTATDFKVGDLLIHKKSRKVYKACDDQKTLTNTLLVIGQRNGKDYGPVRFINMAMLEKAS